MYELINIIKTNNILTTLSVIILLVPVVFVVILLKNFNIALVQFMFSRGINTLRSKYKEQRLADNVKTVTQTIKIKLTWFEKLEIKYVDKPLLRKLVFFANIYVVILVSILFFLAGFWVAYTKTYHIGLSMVVGILTAAFLYVVLNLRSKYLCENIRNMLAPWVSILNKASDTKEDVVYILESSIPTIQEPLKSHIQECVIQMKNGLSEYEALDLLGLKVDSQQFKDFILNLKQNIKHRGNIKKLLANCEEEFFLLQDEYERRKITTFASRIRIYIMMFFVLAVGYYLLQLNPSVKDYYMNDPIGKWVMTGFLVIYFVAFVISTQITKFDY